jgi:hypothetical protein
MLAAVAAHNTTAQQALVVLVVVALVALTLATL